MRDLAQNFVEGDTQGEIAALGNCRARLLPLVQRVEFLDTLKARTSAEVLAFSFAALPYAGARTLPPGGASGAGPVEPRSTRRACSRKLLIGTWLSRLDRA